MNSQSERGASTVFLALSLVMLGAFAALGVDAGQFWTTRRSLVTATDAAALAGANAVVDGQDGCSAAYSYLQLNYENLDAYTCTQTSSGGSDGVIQVTATDDVAFAFAPIIGISSRPAESSTSASFGVELESGLRPFAFCEQATTDLQQWLVNPTVKQTIRFSFTSDTNVAACSANGAAPGNWGFVDFNGGSNNTPEIVDWILNSYPEGVMTTSAITSCSVEPVGCYEGSPGALSGAHKSALTTLKNSGALFSVALFSHAEGNGANLQMKLTKIVSAKLTDFKVTGKNSGRYIEVELQPGIIQDGDPEPSVKICSVDGANC